MRRLTALYVFLAVIGITRCGGPIGETARKEESMTLNDLLDKLSDLGVVSVTKGPHSSRLVEYPYPWNAGVELRTRDGLHLNDVSAIQGATRARVYLSETDEGEHEC